MGKPHKHAKLIKAWADGAEIEYLSNTGQWLTVDPTWSSEATYRIKSDFSKYGAEVGDIWVDENNKIHSILTVAGDYDSKQTAFMVEDTLGRKTTLITLVFRKGVVDRISEFNNM